MGSRNYSVNRKKDGTVIYEVEGALYSDLAQVPDASDRAALAAMQTGPFERDPETDSETIDSMPGARTAEAARMRIIFLCVFGGIAIILLLVAAITAGDAITQVQQDVKAAGQVVGMETEEEYSYPVVAFTDRDGVNHTVQVNQGSSPPEWYTGDRVTVLYDPGNPQRARIDSFTGTLLLWLAPGVSAIVGIGFLLAVFVILRVLPPETG